MKKFFCFHILFCLLLSLPAFAQSDSTLSRHEVGMDLMPLFRRDPAVQQSAGLLYRRYQENSAFRMRVQAGFGKQITKAPQEQLYESGLVTLRAGKEWHRNFAKMRFYYGLDAKADLYYSYSEQKQPQEWLNQTSRGVGVGILPLLGFYYKINRHFGLSAETNATLQAKRSWEKTNSSYGSSNFRQNYFAVELMSEFALFLTYRF